MDEFKNENVTEEPVTEQRPSTKYGRTAYQQQVQEEQGQQPVEVSEGEQPQQNAERPYQQYQQSNWQEQNTYAQSQYNAYTPYEEVKPEVKNVFAHILMALVAVSNIISFVMNVIASRAYSMGDTLEEVVDATLAITQEPATLVLSLVSDLVFWITVVFLVLDIIQLHKAGKKIGGAIAFAIFLRPAYFIWRAHLLGQKKTLPIIYAVVVYLISFAQFGVLMVASMEMVMRTMY